ncbi:hypothetical protein EVAR_17376_1 [Eumeta japonica]|uniref:Uncharacterized protein n=1 Tax=Eumeta variegata TaxID=151549 RepID=A0A4C1WJ29_EUMVA|nr:hypothetical protein EVAR_17376_1 [Eumeta japonica]
MVGIEPGAFLWALNVCALNALKRRVTTAFARGKRACEYLEGRCSSPSMDTRTSREVITDDAADLFVRNKICNRWANGPMEGGVGYRSSQSLEETERWKLILHMYIL